MNCEHRFAVVGGDLRQVYLAQALIKDGFDVATYALDQSGLLGIDTLQSALDCRDVVLLPVPMCSGSEVLFAPLSAQIIPCAELAEAIPEYCTVFAGKIPESLKKYWDSRNIRVFDYLEQEDFSVRNAIATAEAAIVIAGNELPFTLFGSRCLVCGYGRIGKILAQRLSALGAEVTVSARKESDFAWIEASGFRAMNSTALSLEAFDVIFNTIPHKVLDRAVLSKAKNTALILELASSPGGIDTEAAKEFGIPINHAQALPGKYAPVSAAQYLKQSVQSILSHR